MVPTVAKRLSFTAINIVIESWESLRRTPDYQRLAGQMLFQRLFEKCPESKLLFGYPVNTDVQSLELLQSKRFQAHAASLLEMIDMALHMLGPDIELLTESMHELGLKHIRYGVTPHMFPVMGEALIYTLANILEETFTDTVRKSWVQTYRVLSEIMMDAQLKALSPLSCTDDYGSTSRKDLSSMLAKSTSQEVERSTGNNDCASKSTSRDDSTSADLSIADIASFYNRDRTSRSRSCSSPALTGRWYEIVKTSADAMNQSCDRLGDKDGREVLQRHGQNTNACKPTNESPRNNLLDTRSQEKLPIEILFYRNNTTHMSSIRTKITFCNTPAAVTLAKLRQSDRYNYFENMKQKLVHKPVQSSCPVLVDLDDAMTKCFAPANVASMANSSFPLSNKLFRELDNNKYLTRTNSVSLKNSPSSSKSVARKRYSDPHLSASILAAVNCEKGNVPETDEECMDAPALANATHRSCRSCDGFIENSQVNQPTSATRNRPTIQRVNRSRWLEYSVCEL